MNAQAQHYAPPATIWSALEPVRAIAEASLLGPASPLLMSAPRGDGHPVMVLPGFMASDNSTAILRTYLSGLGYEVYPWALGRNFGPRDDIERRMVERVNHIAATHDRRVSLVGWSLGGIFARQIARDIPDAIRQVITLGSPFGSPGRGGTHKEISELYERLSGDRVNERPAHEHAWQRKHPPVPCTAIFSKTDGVAAWQVCVEDEHEYTDNIEVCCSHSGLGFNPFVLYAIADRLAQPADEWQPFERNVGRSFFYK